MNDKYILDGHTPVVCNDLYQWGRWFETADRHIAKTDIPIPRWKFWLRKILKIKKYGPIRISTVFLGLDHSFGGDVPILFETMVFGGKLDQEMERYTTWEQAEEGHKKWVANAKGDKE